MPVVQHLIADTFGAHLGRYGERLKLTKGGELLAQAPLMHLETVTIANHAVSISADAIAACCERGIPIHFMQHSGEIYAALYAAGLVGTVLTRRAQLLAYYDERGFLYAATLCQAKIRNQSLTLRYWSRNRSEHDPTAAHKLAQAAADTLGYNDMLAEIPPKLIDESRSRLMGLEGNAARIYWSAAQVLVPASYAWPGRVGRGATDPINALLNYGYGILYREVERAIVLAGLDPFGGFLHADRPGKPSLVLDLIEEFRQMAVDRPVFGLAARQYIVEQDDRSLLSQATRRDFAAKILKQLDGKVRYQGGRTPLRFAIQTQARSLASFLRGDQTEYRPFQAEG